MQSGKEGSEGIVAAKLEKQAAADRGDDGSSSFEDDEDSSDAQSEEDEEPVTENSDSEGKEVNKLWNSNSIASCVYIPNASKNTASCASFVLLVRNFYSHISRSLPT